jgi:aspartyl protease family protein
MHPLDHSTPHVGARKTFLAALVLLAGGTTSMTRADTLGSGTLNIKPREYIIYDGQNYQSAQLETAIASPVIGKPAQRLGSSDYSVPRAADGHYYLSGTVNGFPVVFMVDTGAQYTSLPANLARNAGIRAARVTPFDTAAGRERGGLTAANAVTVGPFTVPNTPVAVMERLSIPLLGMDVLNRFQVFYAGGVMVLRNAR